MSKAKRTAGASSGKVAAFSHQSVASSSSSSRQVEVSPTISNILQELQQLIKKTQVGVVYYN